MFLVCYMFIIDFWLLNMVMSLVWLFGCSWESYRCLSFMFGW